MFLDILIIAILVITMVSGFRKGFVYTFTHTLGWLGAMLAAFFFSSPLRALLAEKTQINDSLHDFFMEKLSLSSESLNTSADSFPVILGRSINTAAEEAASLMADKLTAFAMILLAFILIFLVSKCILFFLTIALSKRENNGFTGFFDGVLGLLAGMIRGIIFVFLFLALLMPVVNLISPLSAQLILSSLDNSYFAGTLYDSNFILLIINDFLL